MKPLVAVNTNTIDQFVASEIAKGHVPNKLINEKSPYLLQHAFNPVQWYPWGKEAFDLARRENKPIFLSIGYSTCHWCHVMEKESFENLEVAAFLNEHFISIKIDREERPDLDQVYMTVTQAMTGSGGWPMSVFLTPELQPFYAGTYFPPESKYGRPGFLQLLDSIQKAWKADGETIVAKAKTIVKQIEEVELTKNSQKISYTELAVQSADQFKKMYDPNYGGFGRAPKFPRPVAFNFLLRHGQKGKADEGISMSKKTLREMAKGGMYDQLGGGFHRYSVDAYWRVPHFEKMLYDQALLVISYLEMYQISRDGFFADIAGETLSFVLENMASPEGAFYSALDADSVLPENPKVKSEGAFYLWGFDEINKHISASDAKVFSYYYGVKRDGNTIEDPHGDFGKKNVLYRAHSLGETAKKFSLDEQTTQQIINAAKAKLLKVRNQRPHPHLDDKILASWNGLMLSALARGALVLDEPQFLEAALRSARFIESSMLGKEKQTIFHRYRDNEVGIDGQIDDYAFVSQGFIDLYEATFDVKWLLTAKTLTEKQIELYADKEGGFYESRPNDTHIILKLKSDYDGAEPSGNSVSALNLLRLGQIFGNDFSEIGEKTIYTFTGAIKKSPTAMPQMLAAYNFMDTKPMQVIIVGEAGSEDTIKLQKVIATKYLPNTIILSADENGLATEFKEQFSFLGNMTRIDGKATAYVCKDLACMPPTNNPQAFGQLLSQ